MQGVFPAQIKRQALLIHALLAPGQADGLINIAALERRPRLLSIASNILRSSSLSNWRAASRSGSRAARAVKPWARPGRTAHAGRQLELAGR